MRIDRRAGRRLGRAALSGLVLACVAAAGFAESRGMTPEQLIKLRWVREAKMSPAGDLIAYTLRVPRRPGHDEDGGAYEELHVATLDGETRAFVTGKVNVARIEFTPDGRGISFLAKLRDDKHRSLYVIRVDGGQAQRAVGFEADIQEYQWAPDGVTVAFRAAEPQDESVEELREHGFRAEIYEEDWRPEHLYVVRAFSEEPPRALELPGAPGEFVFRPDGKELAVTVTKRPLIDERMMFAELLFVDATDGRVRGKVDRVGKLASFAYAPDGKHLALIMAADLHDPAPGRLAAVPSVGGEPRALLPDFEGHVERVDWADSVTVRFLASEHLERTLGAVKIDGGGERRRTAPDPGFVVSRIDWAVDSDAAALVASTGEHPWELFVMENGVLPPRRITDSNPWLADVSLGKQEPVTYSARDGLEVEGVLIYPVDYQAGTRYPLVEIIHGGPESHVDNGWNTYAARPGQALAARGYMVFYPNYRGSTGRGVAYSKLDQHDYAGAEFDDLVDAIAHLDERGLIDPKRVGVTGGSYGGFASAWCATKLSEHFAASVMSVGLSDHVSFAGTTDIPHEMKLVHAQTWPWDDWDWYRERSPIYHVKNAKTPILIIHGKDDTRVHPSQSMELHRYIKTYGDTPVRLVLYPGEGHGNSRQPGQYDYVLRLLRWFDHYLKGPGGDPPDFALEYDLEAFAD